MTYVFDGLLVALFLLCVWLGWRRGFVRTVSGLIALIAAVLVAAVFSGPIAKAVYTGAVEPKVTAVLEQHIEGDILPSEEKLDAALEKLPSFVTTLLEAKELDSGAAVLAKVEALDADESAAEGITRQVITPVALPLIKLLCSVVLFILAYIVAAFVLRALDVVAKLPLIKQMNNLLGLLAGAVTGALWVLFAVRVLYTLALLGVAPWLTPALLEDTVLVAPIGALLPTGA